MSGAKPAIVELAMDKLEDILRRAEAKQFNDEDYAVVKTLFQSYVQLTALLKDKNVSLGRLRKMLFGASTEKTAAVVGKEMDGQGPPSGHADVPSKASEEAPGEDSSSSRKGHGRNGAEEYGGAEQVQVPHPSLVAGDACPDCHQGTVYQVARGAVLVRIVGQAPMAAKVYHLQKLRCHLCGKVFTAPAPEGVGQQKYDATAGSMVALLKYGTGMPFNRLEGLQGGLGIPLPASTQWDIMHALAKRIRPAYRELIRQAADGEVLYNDDTTIKILELMGKRARPRAVADESGEDSAKAEKERSGLFTSGIVSTREGRRIALFFSGRKHAGENLQEVLSQRAEELGAPIQMCDALSRNLPGELKTILAHCLAHGRRRFVDVAEHFPDQCRHVLEALAVIYRNDALARRQNLSPQARLEFHRAHSGATMEELHAWLARQFDDRLVEPNSSLGASIAYMLKHWDALTLFLRQPGAPLDNNLCERALKKAILHRKNALFYKTAHGARVGDLLMSLIYTCQLNRTNPFDYLTELQRHEGDLSSHPQDWMPWNYRKTVDGIKE
jgi:transposase